MSRTILIAAASSGSGKTTITIGLLRALQRRGMDVQPYKCGPDYIDTQYHGIACGRDSYNLDLWMNGADAVRRVKERADCSLHIIEGAMGLYDGAEGMAGSAAAVAETLGAEVVLVVNAKSMAHSVAPLLYGYMHWRPQTKVCAVIFNNVGSERHAHALMKAAAEVGVNCLGCMPRQRDLYSPSRHLGLDLTERDRISHLADIVADEMERHIDLDWFVAHCDSSKSVSKPSLSSLSSSKPILSIACDEAFNFTYAEALDMMRQQYDVRFFSPLNNEPIDPDASAVYMPGGYPELFISQLSLSTCTMKSLQATKAKIVAECGGMMYLGQSIDGTPMAGLLPFATTMQRARLHLGYRRMMWRGQELRGHEFHYSDFDHDFDHNFDFDHDFDNDNDLEITNAQGKSVDTRVYVCRNIIASYVHWSPAALLWLLHGEER